MHRTEKTRTRRRVGMALVPALLFITLFGALSAAIFTSGSLNLRMADNFHKVQSARFAAESGMAWMLYRLKAAELPRSTTQETLLDNLHTELFDSGLTVTRTDDSVLVSGVGLPSGSFACAFALPDPPDGNDLRLTVSGACQGITRKVAVTLDTDTRRSGIFDFGIASKGKISIDGSATVTGMTSPGEGNILSAKPELVAIEAGGNAEIGGDLHLVSASKDSVDFTGKSITVAGESDPDVILNEHVHLEVDAPEFPAPNVAPFAAMTAGGMVIDSSSDINGISQLTNAVIEPNTNPNFSSDTTVNGVLYIRSPNKVTFTGSVTINAIIVTDDPADPDLNANQIDFRGNVTAPGVAALPDTPQFEVIKQHSGTVVLAPGYDVTFRGGTSSINGIIAADQISFRGSPNVSGDIAGSIIGLKDLPMTLQGNTTVRIHRTDEDFLPAGFVHPYGVSPIPSSYTEEVCGD